MSENVTVALEDARSPDAARLLDAMCTELSARYHRPPSPFVLEEVLVVARLDGDPVGCGALRQIDATTVEVKRMYVVPTSRRRGVARRVLGELERVAAERGNDKVILETGIFQPEALALYASAGYRRTENYGRYVGNPEACCFEKDVEPGPGERGSVR